MTWDKLLKHAAQWQYTFIAAVIVLSTIHSAWGGRIDAELLQSLKSAPTTDEYAVIVKLSDKVDFRPIKASLAKEERKVRLSRVVQALRDKATTSRVSIKNDLDAKEREGTIRKVKDLWIINGFALTANAQAIRELAARDDVEEVVADRIGILAQPAAALATGGPGWNLDMIGAPILWQLGYSGQGVVVANLDSGVDINHPALSAKWRGGTNSWFDAFDAVDPFHPSTQPYDDNGHGTNTMGVMVAGNTTDNLVGVAPGASWIAAKIFDSTGHYTLSGIHSAFQWTLNPDGNPADAPHVVNCSWEINTAGSYDPVFAPDIELLTTAGIVVVFAAGNSGPFENTSVSPANNPGAFSVGATDSSDLVTTTSSRGRSAFDGSIYPAIVAPGSGIRTTDLPGGGGYTFADGTSLAAPHVAGGLALLLSINPNLTRTVLENAIRSSGLDLGTAGPDNYYGYGRLDIVQAARNLDLFPPHIPNGDADGDGTATIRDALAVLQASVGLIPWSATLMYNGDVAPLVGNVPSPDRKITVADALLILRKAIGANPF